MLTNNGVEKKKTDEFLVAKVVRFNHFKELLIFTEFLSTI